MDLSESSHRSDLLKPNEERLKSAAPLLQTASGYPETAIRGVIVEDWWEKSRVCVCVCEMIKTSAAVRESSRGAVTIWLQDQHAGASAAASITR